MPSVKSGADRFDANVRGAGPQCENVLHGEGIGVVIRSSRSVSLTSKTISRRAVVSQASDVLHLYWASAWRPLQRRVFWTFVSSS